MSALDARGCEISGSTPIALDAFERALAAYQSWRGGAREQLDVAFREAPRFVMACVLRAWMLVSNRDPRRIQSARPVWMLASRLPANEREGLHLAAIAAILADDYEGAKARLGEVLRRQPRDVIALQVAHALDYLTGDVARMRDRVAGVLPAWTKDVPGYHAILAMHAFSLEECGEYERAEQAARAALKVNPRDARSHHVMAHVFDMTKRPDVGARWMSDHMAEWGGGTVVATHCWWHLALFHLAQDRPDRALSLYDWRIRLDRSGEVADLIDSAALLWRAELAQADPGRRWGELALAWAPHIHDGFCSFNDLHAMLAFVGARDWERARELELALTESELLPTRYGETTRRLGLPACRALLAFGRGDKTLAKSLLSGLAAQAHSLGGSDAQRGVLELTLEHAERDERRFSSGPPARRTAKPNQRVG
jgi:tetratricopeptide (TPR) repeat protein